jgi:Protein of unknown function (DUF664)
MYAGLDEWPEPPIDGDEASTLLGSLDRQRATFAWKVGGLDAAGLNVTLGTSTVTLGGLVKHLAFVEDYYFTVRLFDEALAPPFDAVDFDADPNWDWSSAIDDAPDVLYDLWQRNVDRSRRQVARALAEGGLGQSVAQKWPDGRAPSLRRTLVDLIEEYARHVGHADLIRESIDGVVGEDPPGIHD